jgi:hypothetical protein
MEMALVLEPVLVLVLVLQQEGVQGQRGEYLG